jgi:hypothetical protein
MKKFSKKGILLFAGAMALCAFMLPSVASAASWGTVGTEHTLTSTNLGFTSPANGGVTSQCSNSSFTADVRSAANLTITSGTFANCTSSGPGIGDCVTTSRGTNFPWFATGTSTTNVQLERVVVDVFFEGPLCAAAGGSTQLTGTLNSGVWNAAAHSVTFTNAEGLSSHPGPTAVTVRGLLTDSAGTLTLS